VTLTINRPTLSPEDEKKVMGAEQNKAVSQ